jgi:putative nucleotidyltransferase with HDIG domain
LIARIRHLVTRFFGSLRPGHLDADDTALVERTLTSAELECWQRLGPADRAESVTTARAAIAQLGSGADDRWVAAALLHDVGKAATRFGPVRRAVATTIAIAVGEGRVRRWRNAIGRYVSHDDEGARLLEQAGARREAVEWAAIHHRAALWPGSAVPIEICQVLATADGEPQDV